MRDFWPHREVLFSHWWLFTFVYCPAIFPCHLRKPCKNFLHGNCLIFFLLSTISLLDQNSQFIVIPTSSSNTFCSSTLWCRISHMVHYLMSKAVLWFTLLNFSSLLRFKWQRLLVSFRKQQTLLGLGKDCWFDILTHWITLGFPRVSNSGPLDDSCVWSSTPRGTLLVFLFCRVRSSWVSGVVDSAVCLIWTMGVFFVYMRHQGMWQGVCIWNSGIRLGWNSSYKWNLTTFLA